MNDPVPYLSETLDYVVVVTIKHRMNSPPYDMWFDTVVFQVPSEKEVQGIVSKVEKLQRGIYRVESGRRYWQHDAGSNILGLTQHDEVYHWVVAKTIQSSGPVS